MRFLTRDETVHLAQSDGVVLNLRHVSDYQPDQTRIHVNFLDKRWIHLPLARAITDWMAPFHGGCILVEEWGIWPSSENHHLYDTVRKAYGDGRRVHEAPGHVFEEDEQDAFTTFIDLAIQFGWGGYIFNRPSTCSIAFSHDEWMNVFVPGDGAAVVRKADALGLPTTMDGGLLLPQ